MKLRSRKALALIVVSWILVVVSLATVTLVQEGRVAAVASRRHLKALLARAAADSAVEKSIAYLISQVRQMRTAQGSEGLPWRDNPQVFSQIAVGECLASVIYYDVEAKQIRYGLVDEASKLHVNLADASALGRLPNVTSEIAQAIHGWRTAGVAGAGEDYYERLNPPYSEKDERIENLSELLFVKGIDGHVLYGDDVNRNFRLEPGEDDGETTYPPDDADGEIDPGLIDHLTVYSYDVNRTNTFKNRVNVNRASVEELSNALAGRIGDDKVVRIVQYRNQTQYATIADLMNVPTVTEADFRKVADLVTVTDSPILQGLVNVNTASRAVLATLPGLEEKDVDEVVKFREGKETGLGDVSWLLGVVGRAKFSAVVNRITVRSLQFSADVVAILGDTGVYRRLRVVFDLGQTPVQILLRKDVTHLGPAAPREEGR